MLIENFIYPVLAFKANDRNIYATGRDFGIVSKGGEKFYRDLTIIDAEGNTFRLTKAKIGGPASLGTRLRYFQMMWQMELDFEETGKISIDELRDRIMKHIRQNPNHWVVLDTLDGIKQRVDAARNFKELIMIFK